MYSLTQRFSRTHRLYHLRTRLTCSPSTASPTTASPTSPTTYCSSNTSATARNVRRAITVLKTRATKNDTQVREFTITADGITLGDTIDSRPSNAI